MWCGVLAVHMLLLLLLLLLLLQGDEVLINGPLIVRIGLCAHGGQSGLSQCAEMGARCWEMIVVQCQVFIEQKRVEVVVGQVDVCMKITVIICAGFGDVVSCR
jgi:hypothetical protein